MIGSIALMLLGAAAAPTPCDGLASLKLDKATITSARFVAEGPVPTPTPARPAPGAAPARGAGGGRADGQGGRGAANAPAGGRQAAVGPRAGGPPAAPRTIPEHCRVQLVLKPSSDSLINMELWLPPADKWNGKFMGVGNGGFAGSIQGMTNDMPQALRLGYATAGTDTGHQEQGGDWAIGHPEKMIDFGYRATHEMTVKAKQVVKEFYDRAPQYSYFKGCSTGGRMAVMEAQRYPDDYDGIIAGALANRHIHMWTAGVERAISLARNPDRAMSTEDAALVNNLVMNSCDTHKEGFLSNPRACKVDLSVLKCKAGKTESCLTDAQMVTVETFYGGVKNSKGELIFSGQALGNPIGAARPSANPAGGTFDLVRIAYNEKDFPWQKFDFDRDMKYLDDKIGYVDSVNPDLSKFKSSGAKLLMFHGWSDTGITPETTVWYYEQVLKKMGSNQNDWMRLFMVPGMGHCGGGPGVNGFDQIGTLEKWVEKGVAPDTILGTGAGMTRPICQYPQGLEYKGSGDIKDAANWSCKAPGR
ncbi:MAG TPA: tannase/feruloyl esterase family alpha/beta hydrolase [Vicinamibacterales bacterium]|nr:tannase/feruloyl esterase family alpha/beta hydrolase [Vicinamibacterales bacterium]